MTADNDDSQSQLSFPDLTDKLQPVHLCHFNIRQNNIHHILFQKMQCLFRFPEYAGHHNALFSIQKRLQSDPGKDLIIHYNYPYHVSSP